MTEKLQKRERLLDWASYIELTKPGILMGNLLTALAGFVFALSSSIDWKTLSAVLSGLLFVMASGCVFNNYIDREYDAKMSRTNKRALAAGLIPHTSALAFGAFLGLMGFTLLALWSSSLALIITSLAFMIYVLGYSFLKHYSPTATLVGSLAGAAPPVVGYCALTQRWDMGAWLLFAALVCWQMPHFYAIALFRMKEYEQASIPVLPLVRGIKRTKVSMLVYLIVQQVVLFAFPLIGLAKWSFFYSLGILNFGWIALAIQGFWAKSDVKWARLMFFYSLGLILAFSFALAFFKG